MTKIFQVFFFLAFILLNTIGYGQIVHTFKGDRFTHYNMEDWISYAPALNINAIDTDEKYSYIVNAFEENSLDQWAPEKRMFLYHGTADITVPYQNSVNTYENMIGRGASTNIVTLIPLDGADHSSGFIPYLIEFIEAFESLK